MRKQCAPPQYILFDFTTKREKCPLSKPPIFRKELWPGWAFLLAKGPGVFPRPFRPYSSPILSALRLFTPRSGADQNISIYASLSAPTETYLMGHLTAFSR